MRIILCVMLLTVPFSLFAAERPMLDRVASVLITSGKPEQIGNVDVQDHDVEIVSRRAEGGGTRKYFWRLAEKETLTVTVRLPAEAEDVSARILMDSSLKQGEAHLAWNGQIVGEQDEPFVLRSGEGGRNSMNVYLDDPKPENQIKLTGMKGEIDIAAVEFRYRVPCPSWENDKVRMTLLEPEPGRVVAKIAKEGGTENSKTEGIDLRWMASGPMKPGWIKIEYSETGKDQWTAVPGAEGISFGSKEWPSETGSLTWLYEGDLPNLEFRVLFNRGANPIVKLTEDKLKTAKAASGLRKTLLELKRKSLEEIKIAIDSTLWRRHDAEGQRTATRCLDQAREELSKTDADIMLVARSLADADTAILRAFEKMETSFSGQEDTEVATWKDLLLVVDLYLKERETFEEDMAKATEKTSETIKGILAASPVSFSSVEAVKLLQKSVLDIQYKIGPLNLQNLKAGNRTVLTISGVEYAFRWCPPGTFTMGSPAKEKDRESNETQHEVTLTKGFWMLETEVTQEMWESVMGSNPSNFKGKRLPVEMVSWDDGQEFIRKLNDRGIAPQGYRFSFPTEAQWEYACRAGTTGPYGGTNNLNDMGWYSDNAGSKTHVVGTKQANAWGLFDMHGNVWEWCSDWYGNYPSGAKVDPVGSSFGNNRVYRGGGCGDGARYCRSAVRRMDGPSYRSGNFGLRLCLVSANE